VRHLLTIFSIVISVSPALAIENSQKNPSIGSDNWGRNEDYPDSAWLEEREGTTAFRAIVNWQGEITSCEIISSSGHRYLDEATCDLIERRGKFRMRKKNDSPIGYKNRIIWRIPKLFIPAFGRLYFGYEPDYNLRSKRINIYYPKSAIKDRREGVSVFRATFDWSGHVTKCEITLSSGHTDLDEATCSFVRQNSFFKAREEGSPPMQLNSRINWIIPKGSPSIE
jgi:TonB family protein